MTPLPKTINQHPHTPHITPESPHYKAITSKSNVQLPIELILTILRYAFAGDPASYLTYLSNGDPERTPLNSARERLKRIRLGGHVFCKAVTPALFASVHLHASSFSVARAEDIANSHLAIHVKEIVHHQGAFAGRSKDHQLFLSTLASHRRRQDYPHELKTADGDRFYQHFLEEVEAADRFDNAGDFQKYALKPLIKKFPNCITFVSLPHHDDWHDPETSAYTLKRTGLSYLPMSGTIWLPEACRFITAMRIFKPQVLNMSLFPSEAIHALVRPIVETSPQSANASSDHLLWAKDRFAQLQELKLGPAYGTKYGNGDSGDLWSINTALLLQASENLVSLELTNDYPLNRRFAVLPKDGLPHLRTLTISKGVTLGHWPTTELLECIRNVGTTLQHLHFDNIVLKNWAPSLNDQNYSQIYNTISAPRSSLIRVLYEVTANTNLISCTGLETVEDVKSKEGCRGTYVRPGPKPGKKVLVKKLEEAVCHRRTWPPNLLHMPMTASAAERTEHSGLSAAIAFFYAHWDDTVDEFELASKRDIPVRTL